MKHILPFNYTRVIVLHALLTYNISHVVYMRRITLSTTEKPVVRVCITQKLHKLSLTPDLVLWGLIGKGVIGKQLQPCLPRKPLLSLTVHPNLADIIHTYNVLLIICGVCILSCSQ